MASHLRRPARPAHRIAPEPAMNATSLLECLRGAPPQSREQLLAAAAQASRLLLESSDVMARMPEVLHLLGEAAGVDPC